MENDNVVRVLGQRRAKVFLSKPPGKRARPPLRFSVALGLMFPFTASAQELLPAEAPQGTPVVTQQIPAPSTSSLVQGSEQRLVAQNNWLLTHQQAQVLNTPQRIGSLGAVDLQWGLSLSLPLTDLIGTSALGRSPTSPILFGTSVRLGGVLPWFGGQISIGVLGDLAFGSIKSPEIPRIEDKSLLRVMALGEIAWHPSWSNFVPYLVVGAGAAAWSIGFAVDPQRNPQRVRGLITPVMRAGLGTQARSDGFGVHLVVRAEVVLPDDLNGGAPVFSSPQFLLGAELGFEFDIVHGGRQDESSLRSQRHRGVR